MTSLVYHLTDEQLAALYRVSAELAERGARESREREEEFFERCRAKLDPTSTSTSSKAVEAGTEA